MNTPTPPYIAFVESDSATNDDWITDHSGDPDDIDWSTYTEGQEAVVLTKFARCSVNAVTGVKGEQLGAGISYDEKYGTRYYQFDIAGVLNEGAASSTWTAVNYLDQFAMDDSHTTGTGFTRFYLIICQAASNYKEFTDNNNARKEYCMCNIKNVLMSFADARNLSWTYQIQGFSVWR